MGRSTLTAGHRCPVCTTVPRAIMLASMPGEEVSSPGPPPRLVPGGSSHGLPSRIALAAYATR